MRNDYFTAKFEHAEEQKKPKPHKSKNFNHRFEEKMRIKIMVLENNYLVISIW